MQPTCSAGAILLLGGGYKPFPIYQARAVSSHAADG